MANVSIDDQENDYAKTMQGNGTMHFPKVPAQKKESIASQDGGDAIGQGEIEDADQHSNPVEHARSSSIGNIRINNAKRGLGGYPQNPPRTAPGG